MDKPGVDFIRVYDKRTGKKLGRMVPKQWLQLFDFYKPTPFQKRIDRQSAAVNIEPINESVDD